MGWEDERTAAEEGMAAGETATEPSNYFMGGSDISRAVWKDSSGGRWARRKEATEGTF